MNHEDTPPSDLPAAWSQSAKDTYEAVTEEHPAMPAAALATLYEACALIAAADAQQLQVDRDGLMVTGSQGQSVAHPLIAEIRQSRVQATVAIRALGLGSERSSASAAGAALVSSRYGSKRFRAA